MQNAFDDYFKIGILLFMVLLALMNHQKDVVFVNQAPLHKKHIKELKKTSTKTNMSTVFNSELEILQTTKLKKENVCD